MQIIFGIFLGISVLMGVSGAFLTQHGYLLNDSWLFLPRLALALTGSFFAVILYFFSERSPNNETLWERFSKKSKVLSLFLLLPYVVLGMIIVVIPGYYAPYTIASFVDDVDSSNVIETKIFTLEGVSFVAGIPHAAVLNISDPKGEIDKKFLGWPRSEASSLYYCASERISLEMARHSYGYKVKSISCI